MALRLANACNDLKQNLPCEFLAPVYIPSFPLRCGLVRFSLLAHCTSDCRTHFKVFLCALPNICLFVSSAAKCKTSPSWAKFNWGSSSGTFCWVSKIVHFCTRGIKGEAAQKIVIYCFHLAPDRNWVLFYSILSYLIGVSCQSQTAKNYAPKLPCRIAVVTA